MTETCRMKMTINERTVFGCCVCVGWIANDFPTMLVLKLRNVNSPHCNNPRLTSCQRLEETFETSLYSPVDTALHPIRLEPSTAPV